MTIDLGLLTKIEEYMDSGDLAFDYENGDDERRYALLDALEKLMELGEKADVLATKLIFKKGFMEQLAGIPTADDATDAAEKKSRDD